MIFKKLYLFIALNIVSLVYINNNIFIKNNVNAQSKTSTVHIKVKKTNNNYLTFKNIPKFSFEYAKPNCKYLKQFDINNTDENTFNNKISVIDNRNQSENNGYRINLTLGNFVHLDNNGQIKEKINNFKNCFSLMINDLKLKPNVSKNISKQNINKKHNKASISTNGSIDPGNYIGNLNWTLSPSFNNVNEI